MVNSIIRPGNRTTNVDLVLTMLMFPNAFNRRSQRTLSEA